MNKEQIAILSAFDAAMQTFTDVWHDLSTTPPQIIAAYGGAAALLILVRQTTDAKKTADHAAKLLNESAIQLGLPANN